MRSRIFIVLCIVVLSASCSKFRSPTVAIVNGKKITAKDIVAQMEMEKSLYDPVIISQPANFEQFRRQALGKLIQEEIFLTEARRSGIELSRDDLDEAEKMRRGASAPNEADATISERGIDPKVWKKAQQRRLIINKLIQKEVINNIPVPSEEVSKYYLAHIQEFNLPAQFHMRQILVDTQEQADGIMAKLKAGEDFATLAKKYSISPDGKRGGDLGFFDSRTYPHVFSEICQQLKPGETSEVVATDYGYQIFQLLDKRPARQLTQEEAYAKIKQNFREEKSEATVENWSKTLRAAAKIVIDEKALEEVKFEKTN